MNLTTTDLGEQVEEMRRVYRVHRVEGLPYGVRFVIIEERGRYHVVLCDVPTEITDRHRYHDSMEAALEEVRDYLRSQAQAL